MKQQAGSRLHVAMRTEVTRERLREAEPLDFDGFFRNVYPRLSAGLLLLTSSRPEAEDIAQEALTRALERWDRVEQMESPEGYVYRIALNLSRSIRRRARRGFALLGRADTASDPAVVIEEREDALELLRGLSKGQREALLLVHWLGLSDLEASRVLKIDVGSVRVRLHRARLSLAQSE